MSEKDKYPIVVNNECALATLPSGTVQILDNHGRIIRLNPIAALRIYAHIQEQRETIIRQAAETVHIGWVIQVVQSLNALGVKDDAPN